MRYKSSEVEDMLRNYYDLNSDNPELQDYKIDLDMSLAKLKKYSVVLYSTITNVFIIGLPINKQAEKDKVSRMQVNRRLHDGLHVLTMIMNGEVL